jgi:hypothetical protein
MKKCIFAITILMIMAVGAHTNAQQFSCDQVTPEEARRATTLMAQALALNMPVPPLIDAEAVCDALSVTFAVAQDKINWALKAINGAQILGMDVPPLVKMVVNTYFGTTYYRFSPQEEMIAKREINRQIAIAQEQLDISRAQLCAKYRALALAIYHHCE